MLLGHSCKYPSGLPPSSWDFLTRYVRVHYICFIICFQLGSRHLRSSHLFVPQENFFFHLCKDHIPWLTLHCNVKDFTFYFSLQLVLFLHRTPVDIFRRLLSPEVKFPSNLNCVPVLPNSSVLVSFPFLSCITTIALMHDDIRLSLGLRVQILNFLMNPIPKQEWWNEYPRENNTKSTKVWENAAQTKLGGEFLLGKVIAQKIYCVLRCRSWPTSCSAETTPTTTPDPTSAAPSTTRWGNRLRESQMTLTGTRNQSANI